MNLRDTDSVIVLHPYLIYLVYLWHNVDIHHIKSAANKLYVNTFILWDWVDHTKHNHRTVLICPYFNT